MSAARPRKAANIRECAAMMSPSARPSPFSLTRTTTVCCAILQESGPKRFHGQHLAGGVDRGRTLSTMRGSRSCLAGEQGGERRGNVARRQTSEASFRNAVLWQIPRRPCCMDPSRPLARVLRLGTFRSRTALSGGREQGGNRQILVTRNRVLSLVRWATILVSSIPWQHAPVPSRLGTGDQERGRTLGVFLWRGDSCRLDG